MDDKYINIRQEKIYNFIRLHNFVTILDIKNSLELSDPTIRRDIKILESQGSVYTFHGGVYAFTGYGPFAKRIIKHSKEKKLIAKAAAEIVTNNDLIYIGGGSTLYEFALALSRKKNISKVTVITAAYNIAINFLHSVRLKVMIAGGELISIDESMVSKNTIDFIRKFNIDKAFLGSQAISAASGYTLPNLELSELKKVIVGQSEQVVILCDYTKIGKRDPYNICPISEIDTVVTDYNAKGNKELEAISNSGTKVIIAENIY